MTSRIPYRFHAHFYNVGKGTFLTGTYRHEYCMEIIWHSIISIEYGCRRYFNIVCSPVAGATTEIGTSQMYCLTKICEQRLDFERG